VAGNTSIREIHMGKRSNLILTIGLAVFVIGAAATFLVARNGGDYKAAASGG